MKSVMSKPSTSSGRSTKPRPAVPLQIRQAARYLARLRWQKARRQKGKESHGYKRKRETLA
jgi:hypothetical protein